MVSQLQLGFTEFRDPRYLTSWRKSEHRCVDHPPPRSGIVFLNKEMVLGLRVVGDDLKPCEVLLDEGFQPIPIAHAAGIPLLVKREAGVPRHCQSYRIVRMMTDPRIGVAPMEWQYGGLLPPAPSCLVARSDGNPFSVADWYLLDDHAGRWTPACEL